MTNILANSLYYFSQLLLLTIVPIAFVITLYWLERTTARIHMQTFGWRGVLISTAWLGTPIHEISHTIIAVLFRFRINEIKLFHPDHKTGTLGYINYSYNPHNIIQVFGQLPVGVAPMYIGGAVLCLFIIIPSNGNFIFNSLWTLNGSIEINGNIITQFSQAFVNMYNSIIHIFQVLDFQDWRTYIFLYLSICVSSHMAPSHEDFKGAWIGVFILLGILFIATLVMSLLKISISYFLIKLTIFLKSIMVLLLLAILMSLVNLIISTILMIIKRMFSR